MKKETKLPKNMVGYVRPETYDKVGEWFADKDLNDYWKQYLKLIEELGETASAILKQDRLKFKDGIGDCGVVLIGLMRILNKANNLKKYHHSEIDDRANCFFEVIKKALIGSPQEAFKYLDGILTNTPANQSSKTISNTNVNACIEIAYNEIKDRKGKTVNGTFIKEN